jgi:uncharacterized protein (DUF433 family)
MILMSRQQQRKYLEEVVYDFPNLIRRMMVLDAMRYCNRVERRTKAKRKKR